MSLTTNERAALISPCGLYRYWLRRAINNPGMRQIVWVMLNPSTADDVRNDPTINRCVGFSQSWGFADMVVVNLYALRSTDPRALWSVAGSGGDPVGPENDNHIRAFAQCADLVVCAWGKSGPQKYRPDHVRGIIEGACGPPSFLKLNKDGNPGHPLYLRKDLRAQEWLTI